MATPFTKARLSRRRADLPISLSQCPLAPNGRPFSQHRIETVRSPWSGSCFTSTQCDVRFVHKDVLIHPHTAHVCVTSGSLTEQGHTPIADERTNTNSAFYPFRGGVTHSSRLRMRTAIGVRCSFEAFPHSGICASGFARVNRTSGIGPPGQRLSAKDPFTKTWSAPSAVQF